MALGCLLTFISATGIIGNAVSFLHFSSRRSVSRKASYFKNLLMIVTVADFTLCATIFPMIDAAVSPQRSGLLASHPYLCSVWSVLWSTVPEFTVFLVGMLSISRLVVLVSPHTDLCVPVSYILPVGLLVLMTSSYFALIFDGVLYSMYEASWMSCQMSQFSLADLDKPVTRQQLDKTLYLLLIPLNFITAFSIFPVIISFVLSVIFIQRTKTLPSRLQSRKRIKAAITVQVITFVYIILNIPFTGGMIKALSKVISFQHQGNMTAAQYRQLNMFPEDEPFVKNYLIPTTLILVTVNCIINPIIYYTRMGQFRKWIRNGFRKYLPRFQ